MGAAPAPGIDPAAPASWLFVRVLLTAHSGAGHIGPLLPFAGALRRAGADVMVAAPARGRGLIERAGLAFWPFDEGPEDGRDAIFSSLDGLTDEEAGARVVGEVFTRLDGRAGYPDVLAAVDRWRPDLVMHETTEFAGYLAAERRRIPHVRVGLVLGSSEQMVAAVVPPVLDDLRAELGLAADPVGDRLLRSPFVTLTPTAMEDPEAPGPAQARRFREADHPTADLPGDWWPAGDERPLVYLTFGSVLPQMDLFPGLYRAAIEQLAGVDARVLVTIGRDRDPAELGPLPAGIHVEQWVPQRDVMPHAAAMVCHGGFGTTRMGLSAGVPMVVIPSFADQPFNARRVAALGAGIALEGGPGAMSRLGDAVHVLLDDRTYREAAQRIADDVRTLPSVDEAPAFLAELARG